MNVHGKVMIVDDRCARVGSANLTNRSMGVDTECDLVLDAELDPRLGPIIASLRNRLLAEHLDCDPQAVADALDARGSLIGAVESLRGRARSLAPLPAAPGDRRGRGRRRRRGHREAAGPPRVPRRPRLRSRAARPRSAAGDAGPRRPAPARPPIAGRLGTGDRGGGRARRRLAADAAAHAAQRGSGGRPRPRDRRSPGGAARGARRPTWSGRWCSSRSRCCSARPRCCSPRPPPSSIAWSARCPRRSRPTESDGWSDAFARAGWNDHACCGSGGSCAAAACSP